MCGGGVVCYTDKHCVLVCKADEGGGNAVTEHFKACICKLVEACTCQLNLIEFSSINVAGRF